MKKQIKVSNKVVAKKNQTKLKLPQNHNPLVFEVISRPTYTSNGKCLRWGVGTIRYEHRNQVKHLNDFFPGINREPSRSHIEKLTQSIEQFGFVGGGIIVGIIKGHALCGDASHRWYACVGLERDIPIVYSEFDTVEEFMDVVITVNNSGKNWSTTQYISTHGTIGRNNSFNVLSELKKSYQFSNTVLAGLAGGTDIQTAKDALKRGTFNLIEKKAKGYQMRVEYAWSFANRFVKNLKAGDEPLKANNQRIGEAIIHLMAHIQSTTAFKTLSNDLAAKCNKLYKNERTTKQFSKLFIESYRILTEN